LSLRRSREGAAPDGAASFFGSSPSISDHLRVRQAEGQRCHRRACIAGATPKSGYSANSQAKVCATNVVALMIGRETIEMSGINTFHSYLAGEEAISVAGVYKVAEGKIVAVPNSGGVSPADFSATKLEAIYAESWLRNILTEMPT